MNKFARLAVPSAAVFLVMSAVGTANAQSTDGNYSIQVIPVVVDSASYPQRFTIRNPDTSRALNVAVTYFPGAGTTQPTVLACDPIAVSSGLGAAIPSLRALCPQLAEGNQYGYLYLSENSAQTLPFAAYSRIANPQGIGFSVEAFPAHAFTSADSVVTGIRRLAATPLSPAFQTNCFIGNLNDVSPPLIPVDTIVEYSVLDEAGKQIGRNNLILTTIAGGNNILGFGEVYLGDKTDRNAGANTRYSIQVESNGQNEGEERPYRLHCQSSSGHSLGDIVRYNTPGATF